MHRNRWRQNGRARSPSVCRGIATGRCPTQPVICLIPCHLAACPSYPCTPRGGLSHTQSREAHQTDQPTTGARLSAAAAAIWLHGAGRWLAAPRQPDWASASVDVGSILHGDQWQKTGETGCFRPGQGKNCTILALDQTGHFVTVAKRNVHKSTKISRRRTFLLQRNNFHATSLSLVDQGFPPHGKVSVLASPSQTRLHQSKVKHRKKIQKNKGGNFWQKSAGDRSALQSKEEIEEKLSRSNCCISSGLDYPDRP